MFGFNPSNASGLYHLESLFKSNKDDNAQARRLECRTLSQREGGRAARAGELRARCRQASRTSSAQAQKLIWDDAPYLWLQINENVSAVRKGVTGVEVWPIVFTCLRAERRKRSDARALPASAMLRFLAAEACRRPADRARRRHDPVRDLQVGAGRRGLDGRGRHCDPGRDRGDPRAARSRPAAAGAVSRAISRASQRAISAIRRPSAAIRCRRSPSAFRRRLR